jgi:hypothetical protein
MMRAVFVFVPALLTAAVPAAFSPVAGLCVFAVVFIVGIGATKARPERGEF